jgi:hypothetical protein
MRSTSQMPLEYEDGVAWLYRVETFESTLVSVIKVNKFFLYILSIVL